MPLSEFRPEGLLLTAATTDKYARSVLSSKGVSAVQALLKKWSDDPDHLDSLIALGNAGYLPSGLKEAEFTLSL